MKVIRYLSIIGLSFLIVGCQSAALTQNNNTIPQINNANGNVSNPPAAVDQPANTPSEYYCNADSDCVNSCGHGAVNRQWYENTAGIKSNDCLDGCSAIVMHDPKCVDHECIAAAVNDQIASGCTKVDLSK